MNFPFCIKKKKITLLLIYYTFSVFFFRCFPHELLGLFFFGIIFYWTYIIDKKNLLYRKIRQIFNYFEMKIYFFLNIDLFLVKRKIFFRTVLKIDKISFPRAKKLEAKKKYLKKHTPFKRKKKYEYLKLLFK